MNKRLVVLAIVIASLLLSAFNPWPATLTVINYTGSDIYILLKYHGVQMYALTAFKNGNTDDWNVSRFDIERRVYDARLHACDVTTQWGTMDMNVNLRLTFTTCRQMQQWWTPKYWGEPSMEKPNFWFHDDTESVPSDHSWWAKARWTWKLPWTTFAHNACTEFHQCGFWGLYTRTFRYLYDVTDTD